jgi:hypothetical protein
LAVIAVVVTVYPRLRGGGCAAIALTFGVFGIAAGIEAVHYTTNVGPSGDDFTGLLAIPARITLLGLGVVTLWQTRRRHGGPLHRTVRRAAIVLAAVLCAMFVIFPLGYAYRRHACRASTGRGHRPREQGR